MSGALRSVGPRSLRLLLSWLAVYAALVGASPTPAVDADNDNIALSVSDKTLATRAIGQFERFSDDYNGRVRKGYYLKTLMPLSDAAAAQQNRGRSVASPWQNPSDVERWGWIRHLIWVPFTRADIQDWTSDNDDDDDDDDDAGDPNTPLGFVTPLDDAFADPKHTVKPLGHGLSKFRHKNRFYLRDGRGIGAVSTFLDALLIPAFSNPHHTDVSFGQPTRASYQNILNPQYGAIIFDANYSPRSKVAENRRGTVPDLEQLSDLAYFQWLDACREKNIHPSHIKLIFRSRITYAPSFKLITQALADGGYRSVPSWNQRAVFSMNTRPGLAILGTTHGSGSALFLIQHKRILGRKKITEVAVWGGGNGFDFNADPDSESLNLRFVVADA